MVVLRIFSVRILIVTFLLLMVFWSVYLSMTLQDDEKVITACSWCGTMGFESVGKYSRVQEVDDDEVLAVFDTSAFVKQLNVVENGESVLYHDQFVLRGLTDLSLIRKSINNVFFVESSCVVGPSSEDNHSVEFRLDARQACGLESTARANPGRPVFVLHSCPLAEDFALRVPEYARGLLELHNVFVVALDIAELSKGWPHPLLFSSTSIGLLALWQFGGTYCDLDTLILRSLRPLGTNYCGYRDDDFLVGDAVLSFEPLGYGHAVVTQLLNGSSKVLWNEDKVYLTQVMIDQCSQLPRSVEDCYRLTIYDSSVLLTVGLKDVFISENIAEEFVERVKVNAYAINSFSRLYSFSEDKQPSQAFLALAKEFCPDVYRRSNQNF